MVDYRALVVLELLLLGIIKITGKQLRQVVQQQVTLTDTITTFLLALAQ
jgi:hypothetical protein